jgi:hypothetical protein
MSRFRVSVVVLHTLEHRWTDQKSALLTNSSQLGVDSVVTLALSVSLN